MVLYHYKNRDTLEGSRGAWNGAGCVASLRFTSGGAAGGGGGMKGQAQQIFC